jgi:hypothetical protein
MADRGWFPSRLARLRCQESGPRSVIVKCARVQHPVSATMSRRFDTACSSSIFPFTDACCPRCGTTRCHDDAAAPRSVIRVFRRQMYHLPIARQRATRSSWVACVERAIIAGRRTLELRPSADAAAAFERRRQYSVAFGSRHARQRRDLLCWSTNEWVARILHYV